MEYAEIRNRIEGLTIKIEVKQDCLYTVLTMMERHFDHLQTQTHNMDRTEKARALEWNFEMNKEHISNSFIMVNDLRTEIENLQEEMRTLLNKVD